MTKLLAALVALILLCGQVLAADNVAVTAGSGKTMACKDVSAVCFNEVMPADSAGTIYAVDACMTIAHSHAAINIATATTTRIIAPVSAKKTYICGLFLQAAAADNVGVVEGTGGSCGTGTAGVLGGTTAATGLNLSANQGVNFQSGYASHMTTAGTNVDFCLITSAAVQLSGHVVYVQAP